MNGRADKLGRLKSGKEREADSARTMSTKIKRADSDEYSLAYFI